MRPYADAPRRGQIPGTGPEFPLQFDDDPLLGWCAECGYPWEPDESRLPPGTAVHPDDLLTATLAAPLDHCARCGATASARITTGAIRGLLMGRWYDTGLGGWCGACEEAGCVLPGHVACSAPTELEGIETASEYDGQSWRLLAWATPAVAEQHGWEVAS